MLVTDRHRLCAAMGREAADWEALLVEQVSGALAGGVDLVQVREPDLGASRLSQFLRTLFQNVAHSRDRTVVNDRLDVALATGARGVHLPEKGLPVAAARRMAGADRLLIGRSVHDTSVAAASLGADYLVAGSVRASRSHPGGAVMGWERFGAVVDAAGGMPVLGIGGLGKDDLDAVERAGGSGIAAIDWFLPPSGQSDLAGFVHKRVAELRMMFDSRSRVSYTRWVDR
jgi:thiamine-phosphate diphosphorylase